MEPLNWIWNLTLFALIILLLVAERVETRAEYIEILAACTAQQPTEAGDE